MLGRGVASATGAVAMLVAILQLGGAPALATGGAEAGSHDHLEDLADPLEDSGEPAQEGTGATGVEEMAAAEMGASSVPSTRRAPTCSAGFVYAVESTGDLVEYFFDRESGTAARTDIVIATDAGLIAADVNGLAISTDGGTAYAYERLDIAGGYNRIRMLSYDIEQRTAAWHGWSTWIPLDGSLISGAVDLLTGDYLIGGYEWVTGGDGGEWVFRLFQHNAATGGFRGLGFFATGVTRDESNNGDPSVGNGDMAFDEEGNLYVVRADTHDVNIFSVRASEIAAARSSSLGQENELAVLSTREMISPLEETAINGIAFDTDGGVYLGNQGTILRADPTTFEVLATVADQADGSGPGTGTDLASCLSPPTISLRKEAHGRAWPEDQFQLTISREDEAAAGVIDIASVSTTGAGTGVQEPTLGPFPVLAGRTYTVRETMAPGSEGVLGQDYATLWSCAVDAESIGSGDGTEGIAVIPVPGVGEQGRAVHCAFVNTPRQTTLTMHKEVDAAWGDSSGVEWTLTADDLLFTPGQTREVEPATYLLGELEQPGYELASIVCAVDDETPQTVSLTGAAARTFAVPARRDTVCTLTNVTLPGAIGWEKADDVTGDRLSGSVWRLEGPDGYSELVSDHVGDTGYDGLDADPRPGVFRVTSLAWGDYQLHEEIAPPGYEEIAGVAAEVTVTADAVEPATVRVGNTRVLVFGLEKYGYPDPAQESPELIGGAAFQVLADDDGEAGAPHENVEISETGPGLFEITGLRPGAYWLAETTSPERHAPLVEPVRFEVQHTAQAPEGRIVVGDGTGLVRVDDSERVIQVYDVRALELPLTGGTGAGTYLVAGAAVTAFAVAAAGAGRRAIRR